MPKPLIDYDRTNMRTTAVGRSGVSTAELQKCKPKLTKAAAQVLKDWKDGAQGWLGCPDDESLMTNIATLVKKHRTAKTCVVIGIGGSDLGARAAYAALNKVGKGMNLLFAGDNTDPDALNDILDRIDPKTTIVNVISKSGGTIEPMSAFLVIRDHMIRSLGPKGFAKRVVATTDPHGGALRELVRSHGYDALAVPDNIGGRFSILTAVGLFPLACAGIDIRSMLTGAMSVREDFRKRRGASDPALYAAMHVMGDRKRGQKIHVLMPYGQRLAEFGKWYRQLWAESLGKKRDRAGDIVHVGPTPIAALGATDQHSQIQLYTEGPNDKIVTFIEISRFDRDVRIPSSATDLPPLAYLSGKRLTDVIHAERAGTAEALRASHHPNGTLTIPSISPASFGALVLFFEIAVAMAGELYGINAYDQPGVEAGKRAAKELLTRKTHSRKNANIR